MSRAHAALLVLGILGASASARGQRPLDVAPPFPVSVRGCAAPEDAAAMSRFLAVEGRDLPPSTRVAVFIACERDAARLHVARRGEPVRVREVNLAGSEGRARWWSLALLIVELARAPASVEPPPRDDPPPPSPPEVDLGAALVGWLGFEGPSGLGALELSVRWRFLRVALRAGMSHVGRPLGDVWVGLLALDVALAPLRHDFDGGALSGELFAQGGPGYGVGRPESADTAGRDAFFGLLAVGAGMRLNVGPIELAARLGYAFFGAELADEDGAALRIAGVFGSLAVGFAIP